MARPKFDPAKLSVAHKGMLEYLRFGWLTVAEAAEDYGLHRMTVIRWCAALGIDTEARDDFRRRLQRRAHGGGMRPRTKADLRRRADRAQASFAAAHPIDPPADRGDHYNQPDRL